MKTFSVERKKEHVKEISIFMKYICYSINIHAIHMKFYTNVTNDKYKHVIKFPDNLFHCVIQGNQNFFFLIQFVFHLLSVLVTKIPVLCRKV